jgi:hypothetical protein
MKRIAIEHRINDGNSILVGYLFSSAICFKNK